METTNISPLKIIPVMSDTLPAMKRKPRGKRIQACETNSWPLRCSDFPIELTSQLGGVLVRNKPVMMMGCLLTLSAIKNNWITEIFYTTWTNNRGWKTRCENLLKQQWTDSLKKTYFPVWVKQMIQAALAVNDAATAAIAVVSWVSATLWIVCLKSSNSCRWKMAASASRQILCIMETARTGYLPFAVSPREVDKSIQLISRYLYREIESWNVWSTTWRYLIGKVTFRIFSRRFLASSVLCKEVQGLML